MNVWPGDGHRAAAGVAGVLGNRETDAPLPVPDAAPAIASHGALLAAVHEQVLPVVTLTVSLAPPAHTEWLPGEIA